VDLLRNLLSNTGALQVSLAPLTLDNAPSGS